MSLINQMLKDLEQRRAEQAVPPPLAGVSASGVVKAGNPINAILLGALLMLTVLSVAWLLMRDMNQSHYPATMQGGMPETALPSPSLPATQPEEPIRVETVAPVVMSVETTPSPVAKPMVKHLQPAQGKHQETTAAMAVEKEEATQEAAAPVQIEHLTIRHVQGRSRIMIDLDRATDYRAQMEDDVLSVSLSGVDEGMASEGDETIRLKAREKVGGELILRFALAKPYELNGLAMAPHNEGARLSIDLLATAVETKPSMAIPAEPEAVAASTQVDKRIRPLTAAQQAQVAFQQAVAQLGRGQTEQAQRLLRQALAQDPTHGQARETYAALLLNAGRVSEAEALLREGLLLKPTSPGLAKLYARIIAGQGKTVQAIATLERAVPPVQADPDFAAMLAALYQREQRHGQAVRIYREIVKLRPGMAAWWMGYALSLEALGENEQAMQAYGRSLRAGGLSTEVREYVAGRLQALMPVEAHPTPATTPTAVEED
jgi:Flp pilus assembly protein TadD